MENITSFYYRYLRYIQAKDDSTATSYDKFMALSYAVRGQMVDKWIASQKKYHDENPRRVYYLSMEYVFGKSLKQNIINLGLEKNCVEAADNLGFSIDELYEQEDDLELGNAGIGRLAASIQDSMATLGVPGMAYGLHYDYAVFRQRLKNGMQVEEPNDWLHKGHAWEIKRPEYACRVGFDGKLVVNPEQNGGTDGKKVKWVSADDVIAVPYDFPVPGFNNDTVNTLRLWSAQSSEEFLPDYCNHGDYVRACEEKFQSGRITNYLFPDEDVHRATEMRIKQQYFFIAASLQDIIRRYKLHNDDISDISRKVVIQLNGSKCAIAIAEFMRILVDVEKIPWNQAWEITENIFAYTSHAVSFENLEKWPVYLIEKVLPRHTQIIFDINQHHLDRFRAKGNYSNEQIRGLSIVEEGEVKWVRMANLAILGSYSINGVSRMQTENLKKKIFNTYNELISGKVTNITNGVAVRRWLHCANKPLVAFITELIGESWVTNFNDISRLEAYKEDKEILARFADIKHAAKRRLQSFLETYMQFPINPDTFFDVHCKKIHPYKRQMLQILYILSQYLQLKNGKEITVERTHFFSGKATPSDFFAKQIIHLINIVADIVNNDPIAANKLHVVFVPNYNLHIAEQIIPAADLSEQLATPGFEASGTSNMKFVLNGSHTLGSPGGSNLEIAERMGPESIVFFGSTYDERVKMRDYNPAKIVESHNELQAIFVFLEGMLPSFPEGNLVYPLIASLKDSDPHFVLLEYNDYCAKQLEVETLYKDRTAWLSRMVTNIARSGWVSSDRVVAEYAQLIWKIPLP